MRHLLSVNIVLLFEFLLFEFAEDFLKNIWVILPHLARYFREKRLVTERRIDYFKHDICRSPPFFRLFNKVLQLKIVSPREAFIDSKDSPVPNVIISAERSVEAFALAVYHYRSRLNILQTFFKAYSFFTK